MYGSDSGLLATTPAVNIEGHGADFILAQALVPVGHHPEAGIGHRLGNRLARSAVQPDRIRQLRRALRPVTRAVLGMASRAVVGEDRRPLCRQRRVMLLPFVDSG